MHIQLLQFSNPILHSSMNIFEMKVNERMKYVVVHCPISTAKRSYVSEKLIRKS